MTKRNATINNIQIRRHSRVSLSGIYNACRYHKKGKTSLNKCVVDPRLQTSGMTTLFNNGAFTLIELLVVVLIIGILAAVALPQYRIAVAKSRYARLKKLTESIYQAQELYYLNYGKYSTNFEELDIGMPSNTIEHEYAEDDTDVENKKKREYFYPWGNCHVTNGCTDNLLNMGYRHNGTHSFYDTNLRSCIVRDTLDSTDWRAKICQTETGQTMPIPNNTYNTLVWYY